MRIPPRLDALQGASLLPDFRLSLAAFYARGLQRLHDLCRRREGESAQIPVAARAGNGNPHRRCVHLVGDFAYHNEIVGTKRVVEDFELPPKALECRADGCRAVDGMLHQPRLRFRGIPTL